MELKSILALEETSMYRQQLQGYDEYYESRISLLEKAQVVFQTGRKLSDMSPNERSLFLGVNTQKQHTHDFDPNLFGAPGGNGEVGRIVTSEFQQLDDFFSAIPRQGEISEQQYQHLVELFQAGVKASGAVKFPFVFFTRILTVCRPDYFVSAAAEALKPLCKALGLTQVNKTEEYWCKLLPALHQNILFRDGVGSPNNHLLALIDGIIWIDNNKNSGKQSVNEGRPGYSLTEEETMAGELSNPLNQILFGPPGTGKTYETVRAALEILDPAAVVEFDAANQVAESWDDKCLAREQLKARFDELKQQERVRFVTFHQSFSYEDFVEGLRAETDELTGQIHYEITDGVFKGLCLDALSGHANGSTFDEALIRLQERLEQNGGRLSMTTVRGKVFEVTYDGGKTFRVFPSSTENEDPNYVANMENVQRLYVGESKKGMYNPSYVEGMLRYLLSECDLPPFSEMPPQRSQPFVLIIDEINRGNISRIFGELITLIEPSKRAGAAEALEVTLPYSKKLFKVPGNLYLIGTMNTADRSLAGLDIALRRRFTFKEMPPKPELFNALVIEGIHIKALLEVMNQRIAVLLDRDHCIGHAYFTPLFETPTLQKLADIFKQNIIPLLQEYFFEDWERIRWVLSDQSKAKDDAFIVEDSTNLTELFPDVSNRLRQSQRWRVNDAAFGCRGAYLGILAKTVTQVNTSENTEAATVEAV
ncbi:McrB family protein [Shewanella algae]|uniref:McrB family protein n=1 Tax=Shewanella algae TaxID=38313 RepID=UPI001E506DB4|nr:AAA family ATPase [Shewanella algae]